MTKFITSQSNKGGTATESLTSKGAVKAKTESQKLAGANEARVALVVSLDGEKPVYLAYGATAVKNEGVVLQKGGPPFVIDHYQGEVSVVTASEESVVCFVEV